MSGTRQQIQYSLALEPGDRGEPPVSGHQGAEPFVAKPAPESPASAEQLTLIRELRGCAEWPNWPIRRLWEQI